MDNSAGVHRPGLMGSLAGVARNAFGLLLSRLELAALELIEARNHALQVIAAILLAGVAALFALLFASITLIIWAWSALGWMIFPIMMLGFIVLALALMMYARALLKQNKFSLPATMAELKADRDMLL